MIPTSFFVCGENSKEFWRGVLARSSSKEFSQRVLAKFSNRQPRPCSRLSDASGFQGAFDFYNARNADLIQVYGIKTIAATGEFPFWKFKTNRSDFPLISRSESVKKRTTNIRLDVENWKNWKTIYQEKLEGEKAQKINSKINWNIGCLNAKTVLSECSSL